MQLLSFSICFAVALHVVVAAPFPADNQAVNWRFGGPINDQAAKEIRVRLKLCNKGKKKCLKAATYQSGARDRQNAMADGFGHDTEQRQRRLECAEKHDRLHHQYTRDAADHAAMMREYKGLLERANEPH
jgi:hypothetical protein